MAPGAPAAAFAEAAAADGIELSPGSFDWLCEQGHVGLERVAKARRDPSIVEPVKAALAALGAIFARLGGDVMVLHAARENLLLPVQLVHEPSGTLIQLDELSHFTSFRLTALGLYPPDAPLGFDIEEHRRLCREHAGEADRIGRGLAAKGFGFGGVPRERAYHDALFDLATPAMGHPPLVRVAVPDGDGAAAYGRFRSAAGGAALAGGRRSPPR
ncbi:MAG TPA: hypothetical protein VJU60_11860 [Thermoleophilaceae bacterium]|nr:hypothetical protein [Thermoleophilaceae bacterium]